MVSICINPCFHLPHFALSYYKPNSINVLMPFSHKMVSLFISQVIFFLLLFAAFLDVTASPRFAHFSGHFLSRRRECLAAVSELGSISARVQRLSLRGCIGGYCNRGSIITSAVSQMAVCPLLHTLTHKRKNRGG